MSLAAVLGGAATWRGRPGEGAARSVNRSTTRAGDPLRNHLDGQLVDVGLHQLDLHEGHLLPIDDMGEAFHPVPFVPGRRAASGGRRPLGAAGAGIRGEPEGISGGEPQGFPPVGDRWLSYEDYE